MDDLADLSSSIELTLGELVKAKYNADFFILDQYPSAIRPFYTMPSTTNPLYSNRWGVGILYWILDATYCVLDATYCILDATYYIFDATYYILDAKCH